MIDRANLVSDHALGKHVVPAFGCPGCIEARDNIGLPPDLAELKSTLDELTKLVNKLGATVDEVNTIYEDTSAAIEGLEIDFQVLRDKAKEDVVS